MFKKIKITSNKKKEKLLTDLYLMIPNDTDLRDDLNKLNADQLQIFYERYINQHQDVGVDKEADKLSILFNFIIFAVTTFVGLKLFFFKAILDKVPDTYTAYFYMSAFSVIMGLVISWYLKNEMIEAIQDKNDSAIFSNINNAMKIYDEVKNIKVVIRSMDDLKRLSKLENLKSTIQRMGRK